MATKALVKPELLTWTRNRAKMTVEDAAKAARVTVDEIETWEAGSDAPTLSQLRLLAAKYHFPLAVFYLPEPPTDFAPLRDFRRLPDTSQGGISPHLAFHIRNAYERRELALELHDDLRETVQGLALKTKLGNDAEAVGEAIRKFLGIHADAQMQAARQDRAFDFWRRRIEEHGILVFVVSGPHYSVDLDEMRGFAIARDVLPVIVVNGKDYSQGGKCYTLIHELTHILLGESAISNGTDFNSNSEEQKTERFCDAVAAAALMPRGMMLSFAEVRAAGARKWDDDQLRTIGKRLGVSREALLLRLVTLNRATWEFYKTQRRRFKDEYAEAAATKAMAEKKPIPIKRPILLMSWNGRGFTRLVLRSYYDQRITLNDVSNYLGAKVKHIPALERAAFQAAD
ncbi:MAG: XRE family transcriptional regulator [Acidobacteriaceae bacterium]